MGPGHPEQHSLHAFYRSHLFWRDLRTPCPDARPCMNVTPRLRKLRPGQADEADICLMRRGMAVVVIRMLSL